MTEQAATKSPLLRRGKSASTISSLAIAALITTSCGNAGSQESGEACDINPDYPSGPIEFIVPFDAGGGTDAVGRYMAEELSQRLGTQINVVNRTGGGGAVGHQAMADANPDGQTLGLVTADIASYHHLELAEVVHEDLTGIAQVNFDPAGLTVSSESDFTTFEELVSHAEENPGDLVASGTGQAGIWHVSLAGMLLELGIEPNAIRWVPSEGAAPALQELVAGGIDVSAASLPENRSMIDDGRAVPLVAMGQEAPPGFEDVPTMADEGLDFEWGAWRGIGGPADMEQDTVDELACHIEDIVEDDEFAEFMEESGFGIEYRDAEEFTDFMAEQDIETGEVIDEAGLRAE